jgi:hypothetical protein
MKVNAEKMKNPPVANFHPGDDPTKKSLRKGQMYALAWMEQRAEHGGAGILGDWVGGGKVRLLRGINPYSLDLKTYL